MPVDTTVQLNNGIEMPRLGLGVFRTGAGGATTNAVIWALQAGYRAIDTARVYRNEEEVGRGLVQAGIPRDEIFLTTKLWNDDQGYDQTLRACDASMDALGVEYLDLYLMHWPVASRRLESWRAMERLYESGRVKAIGVSNFMRRHLEELALHANVAPAVNQLEVHPFCQQLDAVAASRGLGITPQAYSPLAKGQRLDDPVVAAIAAEAARSPAQVLLRWGLQHGLAVAVKSSSEDRIRENAAVFGFALDEGQIARLDALEEGLHTAWNPTDAP